MLDNYFPVLVFVLVGLAFGCVPILLGWLIAPNRPDSEKLSAFECGFAAFEDARMKFDVRYYLIAILFICTPKPSSALDASENGTSKLIS